MNEPDPILRMPKLLSITSMGRSTTYAAIQRGEFPKPIRLTPSGRAVGWRQSDVKAYLADPAAWVANAQRSQQEAV